MITDFMQNRARHLVQNQPGLIGFVNGDRGGQANVAVTRGAGEVSIATGGNGPLWFTLEGSHTELDGGTDSTYALATVGSHVELSPGLLVGGMLQVDHAEDDLGGGVETRGQGWLVGPYIVARLGDQPLFFEGRLLYGESDNEVSPLGTFTDDFTSERTLAMIALEGSYQAENLRYFPRLQLSHVRDHQRTYTDSLSNPVPGQTIRLSEVSAGVDFEAPIFGTSREHLLTWGLSGIWSHVEGSGAATAFIDDQEGGRGRFDLGYRYNGGGGLTATADLFIDGLAESSFDSYGVSIGLRMDF